MQAYRGLPILTNQPERPTRLVGIWPLDHEGSVGEYQRLAHAAVDEILAAGPHAGRRRRHRPLPPRRARRARAAARAAARGARALGAPLRRGRGRRRRTRGSPSEDPAAAALVHPNDRRRVVRALELAEAGASLAPERQPALDGGHPPSDADLRPRRPGGDPDRRIDERTRAMVERGVEDEVAAGARRPALVHRPQGDRPRGVRHAPARGGDRGGALRTRQYAAYQRKWLRRIPGVVSVRADRPPDAVADEILEVARARQRLPARRAG